MNSRYWILAGLAGVALAFTGCGKKDKGDNHSGHAHDEHAHEESAAAGILQTTFKEGVGITFPEETSKALGLTTVEAEEKTLPFTLSLTAQIFDAGPPALGSVSVSTKTAEAIASKNISGARLVRVDRGAASVTGEADLILSLDSKQAVGDFVSLTLTSENNEPAVVVPKSALLRTTEGTFVYVLNGKSFLRTAVKLGRTFPDQVEIADGLYAGDSVVSRPVEQLWLTELRFTKGGGHSH